MSIHDAASSLRERKKDATRAALRAAAEDLFAARGYHETTMDDIAARADVSRATAFNYFPRKEAFLEAWVQQRREALADLLARGEEGDLPTPQRLRDAFAKLARRLEEEPDRSRALVRAWVLAGGPLLPGAAATADIFADTLRHGQTQGDCRLDIDPAVAAGVLLDVYVGTLVRWANQSGPPELEPTLLATLDLPLEGIGARSTTPSTA